MYRATTTISLVFFMASLASAHFPWLVLEEGGKVAYFFGENPAERSYKLPPAIAKTDVHWINKKGKAKKVALESVESDDFVGMASKEPMKRARLLMAKVTYGMYAGSRLDYYSIHQAGALPKHRKAYEQDSAKLPLDLKAQLVDTDSGVDVFVMWKGKPLANADVQLFCEDGHEEGAATTDKAGKVSFTDREVEDGLNGIMVGHKIAKDDGELNGEKYSSSSHYLTVTFRDPQDFEKKK